MLKGHGVTGREIGFNNLMPISTPITLGEPKTELGKMIKDAITPPKIGVDLLRVMVISEFAGVGACSPEIYGAKLAHIASCLGRIVDDQFRKEVSDIIRTFPCPLD